MARLFDDGSTQYLYNSNAVVASLPITLACWAKSDDDSVNQYAMCLGQDAGYHCYGLYFEWIGGNGIISAIAYDGSAGEAYTSVQASLNTWAHICAVFPATNIRYSYINGGGKGTDTDTINPTVDNTSIGCRVFSGPTAYLPMSGAIAEAAIWSAALTDLEVWLLWRGVPPWRIRRSNLVGFWLPWGARVDRDFSGRGYHMTAYNGPTWTADPPKLTGISR